jgi:hypothetical protein
MDYDSGATDLTGDAADTDLAVPLQTDDAEAVTEKLHWNIGIPATGVEGICSGTTTVTTIAS